MHWVIKETISEEVRNVAASLSNSSVYFRNSFFGIEKWWFNLIITLLVRGEQTDAGFTFCFGVSPRQIC